MKKILLITVIGLLFFNLQIAKADTLGEKRAFYIDSGYDLSKRTSLNAVLLKVSSRAYFYIDDLYWNSTPQNEIYASLGVLGDEFDNKIYPILTSTYGSEWVPGIDKDSRTTVLIHPMIDGAGGYFRSNDEYTKLQVPGSNEREMVYLSVASMGSSNAKSFLAHEFTHLIAFNQKNKIYGVDEETWLTEMRAEYSPTLLGYDDFYQGSYLQNRIQLFSEDSFDSITEWGDKKDDYGVINLFVQYLIDYYSVNVLADSLHSSQNGINSINYALQKEGVDKDFAQVFTDWTIAVFVNDCSLGNDYCYINKNLKALHVYPKLNFLPLSGESILSVTETTKDWSGNWYKIIGGSGSIKASFTSNGAVRFVLPYVIQKKDGSYSVNFLNLNGKQKGEINIQDFGTNSVSLTLIPSTQIKTADFGDQELTRSFTITVSADGKTNTNNQDIPQEFNFKNNLYYGMRSQDVVHLKIILAKEGCVSGLANTDYFGSATFTGVKCLQNKYKQEISLAAGYSIRVTGFVGFGTRVELNTLLTKTY